MRLAEHLKALRAWCGVMSAWLVETRLAPPERCRDAMVYDLADYGYASQRVCPPPPLPSDLA